MVEHTKSPFFNQCNVSQQVPDDESRDGWTVAMIEKVIYWCAQG